MSNTTSPGEAPRIIYLTLQGDYFLAYGEDAKLVARELNITLMAARQGESSEYVPMAGIPVHAITRYVSALESMGYQVVDDK